jgi:hypothetical protein
MKIIQVYSKISLALMLTLVLYNTLIYFFDNNDVMSSRNIFTWILTLLFFFSLVNGFIMIITGAYMMMEKRYKAGLFDICVALIFYLSTWYFIKMMQVG